MADKITLYPIDSLGYDWDDEPFDTTFLPLTVAPDITLEGVSGLFDENTFAWVEREMGREDLKDLKSVRYAIVHRYKTEQANRDEDDVASEKLVREVAACLRLIRPMRQRALLMQGKVSGDKGFDVQHFEQPINLMEVPEVQKLFCLRNRDVQVLREVAPRFLTVMNAEYWKIRMAVQFHESGHWQHLFWKPRFSLWMAGLRRYSRRPSSNTAGGSSRQSG